MKRTSHFIMMLLAVLISAPTFAQEAKSLDKLKARIQKMNQQIAEAAIKGDTEAGMAFYAEDVYYMPSYMKMLKGVEAMRKYDAGREGQEPDITDMKLNTLDVIKSGNMVIEIGTYSLSFIMPQTSETINDYGKYVTIWEKTDDNMKIKVEIWNTDMNPWSMMQQKPQEKDGGVEKKN